MAPQVLLETPGGYALFSLEKKGLIHADPEDIQSRFADAKKAHKAVSLAHFERYKDVKEATSELAALQEGKLGDRLKNFLKKKFVKKGLGPEGLAVWDKQLAKAIRTEFKDVEILMSPSIHEIFRGVKTYADSLINDLSPQDMKRMGVSLSHSLNRFKLKFSPEKVDVMVIQAVGLLEDIDKELNNLAMRLREWYGFHFPEVLRIINDNLTFARFVRAIGYRTNVQAAENMEALIGIDAEVEAQIRQAAETSMGSDLVDEDLLNIDDLAQTIVELGQRRQELTDYLRGRMMTIAPNLTHMVGEVLGAKLLAASGSLMGLAKQASSTVQILGAEKALFRALKTKGNTPKYGLIYHAALVGQASPKLKGKTSRMLAAKLSLCARVDALSEGNNDLPTVAVGAKAYLEHRLSTLLDSATRQSSGPLAGQTQQVKYIPSRLRNQQEGGSIYNPAQDQIGTPVIKTVKEEPKEEAVTPIEAELKKAKKAKKRGDETLEERAARKAAKKAAKKSAAATTETSSEVPPENLAKPSEKVENRTLDSQSKIGKKHKHSDKQKSSVEAAISVGNEAKKTQKKDKKEPKHEHKKRRTE